jgi:hypothetical protein
MKMIAAALMAAALLAPFASAGVQTGNQTGMFWSQASPATLAAGGWTLQGAIGDHDIIGAATGFFCGSDGGQTAGGAVLILVWDHTGQLAPCLLAQPLPTGSNWVLVDGLPVSGAPLAGL